MGYRYTGPGNLYGLTWIEIHRLSQGHEDLAEALEQMEMERAGARESDWQKMEQFKRETRVH